MSATLKHELVIEHRIPSACVWCSCGWTTTALTPRKAEALGRAHQRRVVPVPGAEETE